MRWKVFGIVLAAALAVPFAALADNNNPQSSSRRANVQAFAGAVTAATPTSVTLDVLWSKRGSTGGSVTVAISSSTRIVYGKGQSSIDPGDLVGVVATGTDTNTLTARRIHVNCNCHFAAGTLGSVGASSFAVNVSRTGPFDTVLKGNAVTFQVNGSTVFVQGKNKAAGAISDLKSGEKVAVIFAATGFFKDPSFNWQTATFTAKHVRYSGALQPAPTNP
jgi:Domain of unknown function (DUF5666)